MQTLLSIEVRAIGKPLPAKLGEHLTTGFRIAQAGQAWLLHIHGASPGYPVASIFRLRLTAAAPADSIPRSIMRSPFVFLVTWIGFSTLAFAQHRIEVSIFDADTKRPMAARIYLDSVQGKPYYFQTTDASGSAFAYNKKRGKESEEYHTTVSAHPCYAVVPPGRYQLTVERGKSYFPSNQTIQVEKQDIKLPPIYLKRWVNPASRGWYSGDLHLHRPIHELKNVVMAEDLNIVFPLTNWVTRADTPPSVGDKNIGGTLPNAWIQVDSQHVIWPRNTEYEIFSVGSKRHTLGALFVLGHEEALEQTVPPWKPVIDTVIQNHPDALFDMDKLAWPFSMTLPVLAPKATYELANNHLWRTNFLYRDWYTPAPPFIQPPFGGTQGGESEWIDFTLGMYYTLLNCGFRMPPSAGTANGVHPVPAGFSRVYVHLQDGFDQKDWQKGLQEGRSFVTTGPMLFARADGHDPGHVFRLERNSDDSQITLKMEVLSEQPLSFGEVLINGVPQILLRPRSEKTPQGAYRTLIEKQISPDESGWFAVRFWEDRPGGRVRFAHTAPWYVEFGKERVKPSRQEREYLITRMQNEMQRSRGIVSRAAMAEYESVLEHYRSLPIQDDSATVEKSARPLMPQDRDRWLENMIVDHQFTVDEIRLATGLSIDEAQKEINERSENRPNQLGLRVLPYPGGRHPRRGFLDGAIDPQRDTKMSIFPPWVDGGYAVVDVPEAIFSNLGLTYLAHEHIPTLWTKQSIRLPPKEWKSVEGGWEFERELPNKITFGSRVEAKRNSVDMEMWLTNGTEHPLTGLRSQVCVMLQGLTGFQTQRKRTTITEGPFIAIQGDQSDRWLITAWKPNQKAWDNPPVPCVHSDPVFPDCEPGKTVRVHGGLWFYQGEAIENELQRLQASM